MIRRNDLDLLAKNRTAKVFRGHLRGYNRTNSTEIGIQTGHVGKDADFHGFFRKLRVSIRRLEAERGGNNYGEIHGTTHCCCSPRSPLESVHQDAAPNRSQLGQKLNRQNHTMSALGQKRTWELYSMTLRTERSLHSVLWLCLSISKRKPESWPYGAQAKTDGISHHAGSCG